jgi:heat shock protein HslJ
MRPAAAAALLLAVAGCGAESSVPDRPAVEEDDLLGRSFSSISVTVDDKPFPLIEGTVMRIDFGLNGMARADAGCNITEGDFDLAAERLDFGGGRTDMACQDRQRQDTWMADVFTATPAVRLDGRRLTLTTADTTIELREVTAPNRPLAGTRWTVTTFYDDDRPSETRPSSAMDLAFGEDEVEVDSGCDTGTAGYTANGETIRFGELVRTGAGCGGAGQAALFDVLRDEVRYVAGESLVLRHPSGAGLDGYEIKVR